MIEVNKIICGDSLEVLKRIPDECVQCCVTSPPYWGLRDYGVDGQFGLESTMGEYVEKMIEIFREVRRVLRKDGTLWLNLGDSYASGGKDRSVQQSVRKSTLKGGLATQEQVIRQQNKITEGLKPKDLCGIPWRVALALQDDGWWLRQDIIWSKPSPMPESVRDRCTKAHEYIFLLSKSRRYYYDHEAIKEPALETNDARPRMGQGPNTTYNQKRNSANFPSNWESGPGSHGKFKKRGKGNAKTFRGGTYTNNQTFDNSEVIERDSHGNKPNESGMRNKRSVWTVPSAPFKEAHFAVFPPRLIIPCILAGCPAGGIILDPFMGSGTTGLVAYQNGRNYIGIELNPKYIEIAEARIQKEKDKTPLFEAI